MQTNELTEKIAEFLTEITPLVLNLRREQEKWIEEAEGFFFYLLDNSLYKEIAHSTGVELDDLQIELLRFESGASLLPHHHDKSNGAVVQVNLRNDVEVPELNRLSFSDDGRMSKEPLIPNVVLQIPQGVVHGFQNDSGKVAFILSVVEHIAGDMKWHLI